jgi:hypothetical protein
VHIRKSAARQKICEKGIQANSEKTQPAAIA